MNDKPLLPGQSEARDEPIASVPRLDIEKYREHMDGLDLTEVEQEELLRTLWWIMATFVQLGFGVDSVQNVVSAFAQASSPDLPDEVEEGSGPIESDGILAPSGKATRHEP